MVIALAGCGDDGQSAASATSNLCANVTGTEAILWDIYNGFIRTDVGVLPPPLPTGGGLYSHPAFPLLGFVYPGGWAPTTTSGGFQQIGVDLIRQDQQAIWREDSVVVNGAPSARDTRDFELQSLLRFLGLGGAQPQVVCVREGSGDVGGGIITSFSNIMIRAGTQTALVRALITPFPGLPNSKILVKSVASPTAEFPERAIDTFLAIDWQLLIGDSSNLSDRDNDGWLDGVDAAPDDPNVH